MLTIFNFTASSGLSMFKMLISKWGVRNYVDLKDALQVIGRFLC